MIYTLKDLIFNFFTGIFNWLRGFYWSFFFKKMGRNVIIHKGCIFMDAKNIVFGNNILLSHNVDLYGHGGLVIGDHAKIDSYSSIITHNHKYDQPGKLINEQGHVNEKVIIGKDVWIGTHVVVLPGVNIGDGAVIGAAAVVTKDIPSFSVAIGNPARVIKKRQE